MDDAAATLTRMLHAIDALDWTTVRQCLADEVRTDYAELSGEPAATVTGDALVEQWQGLLPGFDATQHLTGPVLVEARPEGDGRRLQTHVRGFHHWAGDDGGTWGVHGHYVADVQETDGDWRISALTLQVFYVDGDTGLPDRARARAGERPAGPRRSPG